MPEVPTKYTGQLNAFSTPWFSITSPVNRYCVWWDAGAGGYGGALTSSYEYQLFEAGAGTPSWLPLRFPGQYVDTETGLFENWNRFYDPVRGQYLAADPQLDFKQMDSPFGGAYSYALNSPIMVSDATGRTVQSNDNASGYLVQQLMRSGDPMIRMKMAQLVDDKSVLVTVQEGWNGNIKFEGEAKPGPRPGSTEYQGTQEIGVAGKQVSRDVYAVHWMHGEAVRVALSYGFTPSSPVGLVGHEFGHAWFLQYGKSRLELDLSANPSTYSRTDLEEALGWEAIIRAGEKLPPRPHVAGSEMPIFAAPICSRVVLGVCAK